MPGTSTPSATMPTTSSGTSPARHSLSGDYTGRADLMGYFERVQEQTGGTLRLEPEAVLSSDRHTSMYVRVTGTQDGKVARTSPAEALSVGHDGRWTEFWSLAEDQDVDAFWD